MLDDASGEPLARRSVSAENREGKARYSRAIETQTDDKGGFLFRNLEPVSYELRVDGTAQPGAVVTYLPDGRMQITYPGNTLTHSRNHSTVTLPRDSAEPFILRVVSTRPRSASPGPQQRK